MESGAVATVAAEAGLPFLAVRAVADRADDALPALVEHAVKPDGMPAVGRTLAAMLKNPTQIPATLRLARRTNLALARLRRIDPLKDAIFGGFCRGHAVGLLLRVLVGVLGRDVRRIATEWRK